MGILKGMMSMEVAKKLVNRIKELNEIYKGAINNYNIVYDTINRKSSIQKEKLEKKNQQIVNSFPKLMKKIDICTSLSSDTKNIISNLKAILEIVEKKKKKPNCDTELEIIKDKLNKDKETLVNTLNMNDGMQDKLLVDTILLNSLKTILSRGDSKSINTLNDLLKSNTKLIDTLHYVLESHLRGMLINEGRNAVTIDNNINIINKDIENTKDVSLDQLFECININNYKSFIDILKENKPISQAMFENFGSVDNFPYCIENHYKQLLILDWCSKDNPEESKTIKETIKLLKEFHQKCLGYEISTCLKNDIDEIFKNCDKCLEVIDSINEEIEDLPEGNAYSNPKFLELIKKNFDDYSYHKKLLNETNLGLNFLRNQLNMTYGSKQQEQQRIKIVFDKLDKRIEKWSKRLNVVRNKMKEVQLSISGNKGMTGANIFTKEEAFRKLETAKKRIYSIFSDNKYFPDERDNTISLNDISDYIDKNLKRLSMLNDTVLENIKNSGNNNLVGKFDFESKIKEYQKKYYLLKTNKDIEKKSNEISVSNDLTTNLDSWCNLYVLQMIITDISRVHCYLIATISKGCGLKMDVKSIKKKYKMKVVKSGFKAAAGGGWSTGPLTSVVLVIGSTVGVLCGIGVITNIRDAIKNTIIERNDILNGPSATPIDFFELLVTKKSENS